DAFKQQVQRCWNPPTGSVKAEDLIVRIRIALNRNGTVQGQPEILKSGNYKTRFERIAAESAVRAILSCQPYKLPIAKYERWRDTTLNFDPREMF
ncbi:MAG: cell envelope integrity protein TolA, partial [Sneathiella sp.]